MTKRAPRAKMNLERKVISHDGTSKTIVQKEGYIVPEEFSGFELPHSFTEDGRTFFLESYVPCTDEYTATYRENTVRL
jgi:hypothetical protein